MPAARELPLQLRLPAAPTIPRCHHHALYGLLVLLGASVVVWSVSVTGNPPSAHAGYALAGFRLWLLGIALLLSPRPVLPGSMAAATADSDSAVQKLEHLFITRQPPPPPPA
uniref:Uncharacterized protein n=1 Tax=Oryza brachyantha TaxID=4533 RepID=J3M9H7_ORYBR